MDAFVWVLSFGENCYVSSKTEKISIFQKMQPKQEK